MLAQHAGKWAVEDVFAEEKLGAFEGSFSVEVGEYTREGLGGGKLLLVAPA